MRLPSAANNFLAIVDTAGTGLPAHPIHLAVIISFFVAVSFDLLNQRVDFFWRQFASVLGHAAFSTCNDFLEVSGGRRRGFVGDQRWSSKVSAHRCLAVTLGAIRLKDWV